MIFHINTQARSKFLRNDSVTLNLVESTFKVVLLTKKVLFLLVCFCAFFAMELKAQSRDSNNNEVVDGAIGAGKNNKSYGDKSVVFGYGNTASWKRGLAIEELDDFSLTPTSVFQFEISSLSDYFRGGGGG